MISLPPLPAFMADALCREVGGDLWHPDKGASADEARQICHRCPVEADCLEYALAHETRGRQASPGVWGGMSHTQRVRELRRRGIRGEPGRPRKDTAA